MHPAALRGKTPVFIFERHSDAIIPWAELRRNRPLPARLVTFDSHTDTMLPFLRRAFRDAQVSGQLDPDARDSIPARMAQMDFNNPESILNAAHHLWHDEHIQAAQNSGILGDAFILTYDSPPNSEDQKSPLLHYLNDSCLRGCEKKPHDEDCRIKFADFAIEDNHLVPIFQHHPKASLVLDRESPLILDIDLDYFLTVRSLAPSRHTFFSSIAERADIITIATEPRYVEDCRIDVEIRWETSLEKVLNLLGASCREVTGSAS